MRNPTKKQVQNVIDNFMKVLPTARKMDRSTSLCSLDMSQSFVPEKDVNICKTPMCHGGWYAVATTTESTRSGNNIDYEDGALKIAKHLGFKEKIFLEEWARENPDLWGNHLGDSMFYSNSAFIYKGYLTLSKIVNHWKGVQKRLPR